VRQAGVVRQKRAQRVVRCAVQAFAPLFALLLAPEIAVVGAQVLREPTFVFEPGVMTLDAVSAPTETGSSTGLNLRFLADFRTPIPWLNVEIGTSFAPLGLSNGRRELNEPTFFYGPSIMLLPRDRTKNWLELTLPILGSYHLDENGEAERLYVNDLVTQGVVVVPIGRQLMGDMGAFWSRLTLYAIIEQNLTPSRDATTGKVDRFNPVFLYGVSIPLHGPTRDGR
jgi:hypothetical protein